MEKIYYFRWWSFRKHIQLINQKDKNPPSFHIITEFTPQVEWAGLFNTIPCAAAHHIREARWLHSSQIAEEYISFWLTLGNPRSYSFWIAHSVLQLLYVTGKYDLLTTWIPGLLFNFNHIRKNNYLRPNGMNPIDIQLYYNTDNRDGMESSIGGSSSIRGYRPTLNSYQYGEAASISRILAYLGRMNESVTYATYASQLEQSILNTLWDPSDQFFKVLPKPANQNKGISTLVGVRELHGYTPWYFNIPNSSHTVAWLQVKESTGFKASYGLTTAEQRHPQFHPGDYTNTHECLWNGPVWPYATSVTLVGLANLLQKRRNARNPYISSTDYFDIFSTYTYSQFLRPLPSALTSSSSSSSVVQNEVVNADLLRNAMNLRPWIDENIHPYTGDAIARTILNNWWNSNTITDTNTNMSMDQQLQQQQSPLQKKVTKKGGKDRGKDYNHSAYIDLIISGLMGIKPSSRNILIVHPLVPIDSKWAYFCLDYVKYHDHMLTIVWDQYGTRYNRGTGFMIFVDEKLVISSPTIKRVSVTLSSNSR